MPVRPDERIQMVVGDARRFSNGEALVAVKGVFPQLVQKCVDARLV